nr:hypothetical protein [Wolbachia endosymbiont of Glossina morsitans morsitans]
MQRIKAAALFARINKNDKNDAKGIAQMMRVGRSVSKISCQIKVALGSRRAVNSIVLCINNEKRGNVQRSVSNRIFNSTQFSICQERRYQVEK